MWQIQQIGKIFLIMLHFILVIKPNGTVWLCLDPARLNQVVIRSTYRGPTVNYILPKQIHAV